MEGMFGHLSVYQDTMGRTVRRVGRVGVGVGVGWALMQLMLCGALRLHHPSCDSAHIKDRLVFRGGREKKA